MATITYTDNCPLCSVHGVETPLMQEPPSSELFCENAHRFPVEPVEIVMDTPTIVIEDVVNLSTSSAYTLPDLEFPTGTINVKAGGDGTITVRIPECNLINLRARAEELGETPGDVFQRALDWAFENQWFEAIW